MINAEQVRQELQEWLKSDTPMSQTNLTKKIDTYLGTKTSIEKIEGSNSEELTNEVVLAISRVDKSDEALKLTEFYVSIGLNINGLSKDGSTVVHKVAENWTEEVIKSLLNFGANINAKDKDGKTILHWAIIESVETAKEYGESRIEDIGSIPALIELGADLTLKDKSGQTPLDLVPSLYKDNFLQQIKKEEISNIWMDEQATVIDLIDKTLKYAYEFKGKTYSGERDFSSFGLQGGPLQKGDRFKLKVNPKSPNETSFDFIQIKR